MTTRNSRLRVAGLCAVLAVSSFGAESLGTPTPPVQAALPPATVPATAPSALADRALAEAKRRHIQPVADSLRMALPPPPPRTEIKIASPATNHVWKPGHWAPVKGKWQWVAGEWGVPPTPISVWIEGKYNDKDGRWSPGYWQPDRPAPAETESPSNPPPTGGNY